MYSPRIQKILKAAKISIGDRISVQDGRKTHEGLLMPSPETSDPESIILKPMAARDTESSRMH